MAKQPNRESIIASLKRGEGELTKVLRAVQEHQAVRGWFDDVVGSERTAEILSGLEKGDRNFSKVVMSWDCPYLTFCSFDVLLTQ